MNYGSEPADQVVRYTLEGTEVALKLSGLAAKNFAVFAYAVLKDQKKTKGKTRLVRMLKEQRPLKFFTIPSDQMRAFAQEAKKRGLLFVPIRNKQNPGEIELVVFADDAAKVNRVMDRLNLDFVRSQAGEAQVDKASESDKPVPVQTSRLPRRAIPWCLRWAAWRMNSVYRSGRNPREILHRRNPKRVHPGVPRPAEAGCPVYQALNPP